MAEKAHLFWLYGMWGPITDAGSRQIVARAAQIPGFNVHDSPYRDYQVSDIVAAIHAVPEDEAILVGGTSLGACNSPLVALYLNPPYSKRYRYVHGMWGFQASVHGADIAVPQNVLFAHEWWSSNPLNFGLGALEWHKAEGNKTTNLLTQDTLELHPGDENTLHQDQALAEMQRVKEHA